MRYKHLHLRTQLAIAMIFTAVITLAIFIFGMLGFYIYVQESWMASLSENNRETIKGLIENDVVNVQALTTLVNLFSASWAEGYAVSELAVLLVFVSLAIICSVFIGIFMARRLSQPIESVTHAALEVASGAFDFQVDNNLAVSLEARDLLLSFNKMTRYLETAERESTESAAAIAHELRTPLTVLRGRLQGMSDGTFQASRDLLEALIGQVDTLSYIVNDLETISRLSSGRFKFEKDAINLADAVLSVVRSTAPDIEKNGIIFEHELEPALVRGDEARIRQALNALIENATRYAASGRYIRVETGLIGENGYIKVSDKGPGISKINRERVFDRWWRAENSRSRVKGGSGLGLSVVKAIACAHSGSVKVIDGPQGEGVTFVICIPLVS
jgi:two-component system sensor histidine kinase AdeS